MTPSTGDRSRRTALAVDVTFACTSQGDVGSVEGAKMLARAARRWRSRGLVLEVEHHAHLHAGEVGHRRVGGPDRDGLPAAFTAREEPDERRPRNRPSASYLDFFQKA